MSKAFTKDDQPADVPADTDPADLVPPGAVNYLTRAAHRRFTEELTALNAQNSADPGSERRRRYLTRVLEISVPFDPASAAGDQVRFGATVTVLDLSDIKRRYVIVGIHEADPPRGRISWNSPLGRALLGAQVGDVRTVQNPRGEDELEVLKVSFESVDV